MIAPQNARAKEMAVHAVSLNPEVSAVWELVCFELRSTEPRSPAPARAGQPSATRWINYMLQPAQ